MHLEEQVYSKNIWLSFRLMFLSIAVFVLTIISVLYVFTLFSTPAKSSERDGDELRVQRLRKVQRSVDDYAALHNKLPSELEDAVDGKASDSIKDPETEKEFEYTRISENMYKLCAEFKTDSSDNGYELYEEFRHSEGRECFSFSVEIKKQQKDYFDYVYPTYSYSYPTPTPKELGDSKVESVTTATNYESNSDFPYGFFSNNTEDYGLINYKNEPVTIVVTFKKPEKIASITNIYSACSGEECNVWTATGITEDGKTEQIVKDTQLADSPNTESAITSATVTSATAFKKVSLNVKRGGTGHIHWSKLTFTYK